MLSGLDAAGRAFAQNAGQRCVDANEILFDEQTLSIPEVTKYRDGLHFTVKMSERINGAPNISLMKPDSTNAASADLQLLQVFLLLLENYMVMISPVSGPDKFPRKQLRPIYRGTRPDPAPGCSAVPADFVENSVFLRQGRSALCQRRGARAPSVARPQMRSALDDDVEALFEDVAEYDESEVSTTRVTEPRYGLTEGMPDAQLFCEMVFENKQGARETRPCGLRDVVRGIQEYFARTGVGESGVARDVRRRVDEVLVESLRRIIETYDVDAAGKECAYVKTARDVFDAESSASESETECVGQKRARSNDVRRPVRAPRGESSGEESESDEEFDASDDPVQIVCDYVSNMRHGRAPRSERVEAAVDKLSVLEDSHDGDGNMKQMHCTHITFHFLMNHMLDIDALLKDMLLGNQRSLLDNGKSHVLSMTRQRLQSARVYRSEDADEDADKDKEAAEEAQEKDKPNPRSRGKKREKPRRGVAYDNVDVARLCVLRDYYTNSNELEDIEVGVRSRGGGHMVPEELRAQSLFSLENALRARGETSSTNQGYEHWLYKRETRDFVYSTGLFDGAGFQTFVFPARDRVVMIPEPRIKVDYLMSMRLPYAHAARRHPLAYAVPEWLKKHNVPQSPYVPSRTELREEGADEAFNADRLRYSTVNADVEVTNDAMSASVIDALIERASELGVMVEDIIRRVPGEKRRRTLRVMHAQWVQRVYSELRSPYMPCCVPQKCIYMYLQESDVYAGPRPHMGRVAENLSPMGNMVAFCTMMNERHVTAAQPHLLLLITLMAMLSSDKTRGESKGNLGLGGDGGCSKSWLLRKAGFDLRVNFPDSPDNLRTTMSMQHVTEHAFQTTDPIANDGYFFVLEEAPRSWFFNYNEGGGGSAAVKEMIETGESNCMMLYTENGQRVMIRTHALCRITFAIAYNWDDSGMQNSMKQRFLLIKQKDKVGENNNITNCMVQQAMSHNSRLDEAPARRLFKEMQCVVSELHNLLPCSMVKPVDQSVAYLICAHVNAYMMAQGVPGMCARDIKRVCRYATILCLTEWYSATYLLPGGARRGGAIEVSHFRRIDPFLFLSPDHVVHALGMTVPYMFQQGEQEVRDALLSLYHKNVRDYVRKFRGHFQKHPRCADALQADGDVVDNKTWRYTASGNKHPISKCFAASEQQVAQESGNTPGGSFSGGRDIWSLSSHARSTTEGDASFVPGRYDLNYVSFRCSTGDAAKRLAQMALNEMNELRLPERPTKPCVTGFLKHLASQFIYAHPMKYNEDDVFNPVVEDTSLPKQSYATVIFHQDQVFVHYKYLHVNIVPESLVLDALRDMFNHANEGEPRRYLYGQSVGSMYRCIWLGPGYMPGMADDAEPVRDPQRNPGVLKNLEVQNPLRMSREEIETFWSTHGDDRLDGWDQSVLIHMADIIEIDCSLHEYVAMMRMQNINWCPARITFNDMFAAAGMVREWLKEDPVFTAADIKRFGPANGDIKRDVPSDVLEEESELREFLYSEHDVCLQTPEDLVHDEDLDPEEHMFPNPCFDPVRPENPFTNARRVVAWVLRGQTREQYKMLLTSRQAMMDRAELDPDAPRPVGTYPDFGEQTYDQVMAIRRDYVGKGTGVVRNPQKMSVTKMLNENLVQFRKQAGAARSRTRRGVGKRREMDLIC